MASVQTSAEIDALLHPARQYQSPAEVLADPSLTPSERRAILSSWASDACAVKSMPSLQRAPFSARPATFDQVMDALAQLDHPRPRPDRENVPKKRGGSIRASTGPHLLPTLAAIARQVCQEPRAP
jgi:hypothetical protein